MAKRHIKKDNPTHKSGHRVALYIRVSTEEQAENPEGSIRNQEERLRAAVALRNMEAPFGEITEVFIDRARSGKDTKRPELQRMLGGIRRREITLVLVSELSRLSRSIKDFSDIWELMRASGCGFQSLRENFDTTTAAGEMVLYTVANIAQFERRQVSERVAANFEARAARGLYNGGTVPVGYRLIKDKPGHLDIDPDAVETVRFAFETFLKLGGITQTARALNLAGHRLKRETQGGSHRPRLGIFTAGSLEWILRNKAYIGVRTYQSRGKEKETQACWPAIIDAQVFQRVQVELDARQACRRKPESENRYPYLLTGLVHCGSCGAHLVGKSANGNGGKVPYYEHGWAARREALTLKKVCDCKPFRVQAAKLEPAVWAEVMRLLEVPSVARKLIESAEALHAGCLRSSETKKLAEKIRVLGQQMDVLAERLAELPKSVSPVAIFRQMERLEEVKKLEEQRLEHAQRNEVTADAPVLLASFEELLQALAKMSHDPNAGQVRARIVRSLVHKVEVLPEGFRLHFYMGRDRIEGELARLGRSSVLREVKCGENNSAFAGSNSLQCGAPGRARTCDHLIRNQVLYPAELRAQRGVSIGAGRNFDKSGAGRKRIRHLERPRLVCVRRHDEELFDPFSIMSLRTPSEQNIRDVMHDRNFRNAVPADIIKTRLQRKTARARAGDRVPSHDKFARDRKQLQQLTPRSHPKENSCLVAARMSFIRFRTGHKLNRRRQIVMGLLKL